MIVESIKPTYRHVCVEKAICQLTMQSRSVITENALELANNADKNQWLEAFKLISKLPKTGEEGVPSSMQLRLQEEDILLMNNLMPKVKDILKDAHLITVLRKHFFILLCWVIYLEFLKEGNYKIKDSTQYDNGILSDPDTFKLLAELVTSNCRSAADEKVLCDIKNTLMKWKGIRLYEEM